MSRYISSRVPSNLPRPLLLAIFAVLVFACCASADPRLITGHRIDLKVPPSWVNSGTWSPDGETLLLVDALNSRISRYSTEGERIKLITSLPKMDALTFRPSVLHLNQGRYLLEDQDGHLVVLSSNYEVKKSVSLFDLAKNQHGQVRSLFGWVPMGNEGNEILAFGDVNRDRAWTSAFLRIPLTNPQKFEILQGIATGDPARNFYLLGMPFMASLSSGEGFFLVMAEKPYIMQAARGSQPSRRLSALAPYVKKRPTLPQKSGVESAQQVYQGLESSSLPAGLYGWNDFLYVLLREPKAGVTEWSLVKINPATDKVVWIRRLTSSASHLTVIPGPKSWAFLEKGPVISLGRQSIESLMLVDTSAVEGN